MDMFATTNRRLEQFLYHHAITFHHSETAPDGMTVWFYEKTARTAHVIEQFAEVCRIRRSMRAL